MLPIVRRFGVTACATVAFAGLLTATAGAQLLNHKDLAQKLAATIAQTALDKCASEGYATSVVVVDRDGDTIVALRGDNAPPHTLENARRKAYTAMTFRQTTADYAKKLQDPNSVAHQQVTLPGVIAIPGGVPIQAGNEVIGGVGLSGSPGVDEPCVRAGLDKVKDQLQ